MLNDDDKKFILELIYNADIQAWRSREKCETHWEENYYDSIIDTCERIEKELRKK